MEMVNSIQSQQLISENNHIVLDQINSQLQKLADATSCDQKHHILKIIITLPKIDNLSEEHLSDIIHSYDEFLLNLLDDYFKLKHKVILKGVMDKIFTIVEEYNQKLITTAINAKKV